LRWFGANSSSEIRFGSGDAARAPSFHIPGTGPDSAGRARAEAGTPAGAARRVDRRRIDLARARERRIA
jgi:hypothetical protein